MSNLTQPAERTIFSGPAELVTPRDAGVGNIVRVCTYNVYLGQMWEECVETLQGISADVFCLQEVAAEDHPRDFVRPSQVHKLMPHSANFARLWHVDRADLGNMTLVRGGTVGEAHILHAPPSMPYGTWSEVRLGQLRFAVANIHLTPLSPFYPVGFVLTEPARTREAIDLNSRMHECDLPVIALGDYNTFYPAPGYRAAARGLIDCRAAATARQPSTRPTFGLPFVIDHIFVTPGIEVLNYEVLDVGGSDHRPVLATLRLPATTA